MYIKYINQSLRPAVKRVDTISVKNGTAKPSEEYGALVDENMGSAVEFADHCIEALSIFTSDDPEKTYYRLYPGMRPRRDMSIEKMPEVRLRDRHNAQETEFCIFDTYEIALRAFEAICQAMADGKNYIDITDYQREEA